VALVAPHDTFACIAAAACAVLCFDALHQALDYIPDIVWVVTTGARDFVRLGPARHSQLTRREYKPTDVSQAHGGLILLVKRVQACFHDESLNAMLTHPEGQEGLLGEGRATGEGVAKVPH
jgi:hypothetical protein